MEKARLGNVFTALLEINRLVLEVLEFPGLEMLTKICLSEASPAVEENENNAQRSGWVLDFVLRRVRLRVIRVLLVEWLLLVCETSIKIYTENQANKTIEPETLMEEIAQLQEEEFPLPNEVRGIVEASRKNILFSIKPLLWFNENCFIFFG